MLFNLISRRLQPRRIQIRPKMLVDINRVALNRDINFEEIHDLFLDRTMSTSRVIDEPLNTAFRQAIWSPAGLIPNRKCILTTVTADHKVTLYRNGRWAWEETHELSSRLLQFMRGISWGTNQQPPELENHSLVYSLQKTRSYLLGTMSLAWSPLYSGTYSWAWLITLQRSGHIIIWKAEAPFAKLTLSTYHDLNLEDPSVLKLHPGCSENQLLLFAGSHRGFVKCWSLSWNEDRVPNCNPLGAIIPDEDLIPVNAIEISQSGGYVIVSAAKNNAIVASSVQCDGNGLKCVDVSYAILPGLQISGLAKIAEGNIICVTEDYVVHEINLAIDAKGIFQGLVVKNIDIPYNQTMLCRGLAASYSGDCNTLIFLESIKLSYDHLKCRQPSSLTVYVVGDLQRVTGLLERTESMDKSLLALETYKALNGPNWETIWEMDPENMNSEDNCYLQLLRWFALYKCNVCFVERRYDKEMQDDLKNRADQAEFCLQVRHIERFLSDPFKGKKEPLSEDDLLNITLAYQFMASDLVKDSKITLDRSLLDEVKSEFELGNNSAQEECPICYEPIPFENRLEGKCTNGHKALRCRSSLRTCFTDTFSCRWCGAHYHLESGLNCCILCGGPLAQ